MLFRSELLGAHRDLQAKGVARTGRRICRDDPVSALPRSFDLRPLPGANSKIILPLLGGFVLAAPRHTERREAPAILPLESWKDGAPKLACAPVPWPDDSSARESDVDLCTASVAMLARSSSSVKLASVLMRDVQRVGAWTNVKLRAALTGMPF